LFDNNIQNSGITTPRVWSVGLSIISISFKLQFGDKYNQGYSGIHCDKPIVRQNVQSKVALIHLYSRAQHILFVFAPPIPLPLREVEKNVFKDAFEMWFSKNEETQNF